MKQYCIPCTAGAKIIKEIAAVASVILSSQLKEMLRNFSSEDAPEGTYKPIKCVYHPREPLFVNRQVSTYKQI